MLRKLLFFVVLFGLLTSLIAPPASLAHAPAASVGSSRPVFFYERSFGETEAAYLADINHIYLPVVTNAFFVPDLSPRIVASANDDWLWTTGFTPWASLTISIYESRDPGAQLLWEGSRTADESGFVIVEPSDHALDLVPGNYLAVSDGVFEKGLVLETITMDVFDPDNEIMAGTAPAGRDVWAAAGPQEYQTGMNVTAGAESGAWMADFKTISFDIIEEMRPWSYAQIFDEDGDANEASPPPTNPTVTTGNFYVEWSQANPEEIVDLRWNGSLNLTNTGAHPSCPDDLEYFGNSWVSENEGTPSFFFGSLVGWGTTGTWTVQTNTEINIDSISSGCPGSADIPIKTRYQFFDDALTANLIMIQRTFDFGSNLYAHDVRPFIARLYPADGFTQVLHPDANGTTLVTETTENCGFGCMIANWNGTWFAIHNPATGLGMIVQHAPSSYSVALWVDDDGGSFTNSSSVLLLQPAGGFTGTVNETEYLCFYGSSIWIPSLSLPPGCMP